MVTSHQQYKGDEVRLVKIVRGVIEIETFSRRTTSWDIKSQLPTADKITVRQGGRQLHARAAAGQHRGRRRRVFDPDRARGGCDQGKLDVVEQTPSRSELSIWDARFLPLFEGILAQGNLDAGTRGKLTPIVALRQEVGRIDTEIEGKTRTRQELDQRAQETRQNLEAIKSDPGGGCAAQEAVGSPRSVLEGRRQARPRPRRAADQAHGAEGRARGCAAVARSRAETTAVAQAVAPRVAYARPVEIGLIIAVVVVFVLIKAMTGAARASRRTRRCSSAARRRAASCCRSRPRRAARSASRRGSASTARS